jgi:RHS repeat-associated protein
LLFVYSTGLRKVVNMKKRLSLKGLWGGFILALSALLATPLQAEQWIPITVGKGLIFIPQINFQANNVSPGQYTLSWNGQSNASSYKIERLTADVNTPVNAEEVQTLWQLVAEVTTTSLSQTHDLSTNDLDGHQNYRLSKCQASVCTELDSLYYYVAQDQLQNAIPQDFTLTTATTTTKTALNRHADSNGNGSDNSNNPYAYGKGYSFITGHENPAGHLPPGQNKPKLSQTKIVSTNAASGPLLDNEVLLTWKAVNRAHHYVVSRVPDRGESPTYERLYGEGHNLFASDTSFRIQLQAGTYDFVVYACSQFGYCSRPSIVRSRTVEIIPDTTIQPKNFTVPEFASQGVSFKLTWQAPQVTANLLKYEVLGELSGLIGTVLVGQPLELERNVASALAAGRQYCYKVRAVYSTYAGQYVIPEYPKPHCVKVGGEPVLPAPEFLSLVAQIPPSEPDPDYPESRVPTLWTSFSLTWAAVSGADYYMLERELVPGTGDWSAVYVGEGTNKRQFFSEDRFEMYRVSACRADHQCGNYRRLHFDSTAGISEYTLQEYKKPACLVVPSTVDAQEDIVVSWCAPQQTGVTSYQLLDASGTVKATGSPTTFSRSIQNLVQSSQPGLDYGAPYCYSVKAYFSGDATGYEHTQQCGQVKQRAATPTINPNGGTILSNETISLASPDSDASFFYGVISPGVSCDTLTTTQWKNYNSTTGISLNNASKVCAKASKVNYAQSLVASAEFTIAPAPVTSIADATVTTLTRPGATDIVGQLTGSGAISGGSVNYDIPIQVPPGRQGMEPLLSFSYNSGAGNGQLGKGWSLAGQEAVSRCSANWTQDGTVDKVNLSNDDLLCLNGQKLVVVLGSYGALSSEYRTLQDSFSKIVLKGAAYSSTSSYFEVTSKSGQVSYYGNTTNSVFKAKGSTVPMSWSINKVYDNGVTQNNITYKYSNANGEQLLTDIYYTGQVDVDGDRRVQFTYEDRADISFGYIALGSTKSTQRLADVTTYVGTEKVFNYDLLYHAVSGALSDHSRLASVRQCGYEVDVAKCLPKKEFTYSGDYLRFDTVASANATFNTVYHGANPWNIATQLTGDFNNDGVLDYVRYDQVHFMSFDNNQYAIESVLPIPFGVVAGGDPYEALKLGQLDFNGDGLLDLIGVDANGLSIAKLVKTGNSYSFDSQALGIPMVCSVEMQLIDTYLGQVVSGLDYKHRGACKAEVIPDGSGGHYVFHRSSFSPLYLSRIHPDCSNGICSTPTLIPGVDDGPSLITTYHEKPTSHQFFDFDGDGDPDIVKLEEVSQDANAAVRLVWFRNDESGHGSAATNTFTKVTQSISTLTKTYAMASGGNHWMDANGDGLRDLLVNSGNWYILINKGGTLAAPVNTQIGAFKRSNVCAMNCNHSGPAHTTHASVRAVDYNGDGLEDFMFLDRDVRVRDCYEDRTRSRCKEGNGSESPAVADFVISPLAWGKFSVYLADVDSAGNVTFTYQSTALEGSMDNFHSVDINSDGHMDFMGTIREYDGSIADNLQTLPTETFFYLGKSDSTGIAPDLLTKVNDESNYQVTGFGQQDSFKYLSFGQHKTAVSGSATVDNSDLSGKYYYRIPSTQTVAVQHDSKNANNGTNTIRYQYGDPIYHQAGLGFIGFETIKEIDVAQGTTSEVHYLLDYPLNGKISREEIRETADDSLLQSQTFNWCDASTSQCDGVNAGTYFGYLNDSLVSSFDPAGNALKTEQVTYNSYDDYGNVTQQTSVVSDISTTHTTVADNIYIAGDESSWWVDKIDYSEITKSVSYTTNHGIVAGTNGNKTQRRTLTYKAGNQRQVATETISGSDTLIKSVTTYNTYDSYGNVTKVTHAGVADSGVSYTGVQVAGITEYDYATSSGYFADSEKNGLWTANAVTRTWDKRFGGVLTETNLNGLSLTNKYDWFGRLIQVDSNTSPVQDIIFNWGGDGVFTTTTVQDGAATTVEAFNRNGQLVNRSVQAFAKNPTAEQTSIETFTYDALDRLIQQIAPHFSGGSQAIISYSNFDVLNRYGTKTVNRSPENYTVTYGYSGIDTDITVNAGTSGSRTMSRRYNAMSQLMSTKDADGYFTYFNYDANDNAIVIKDVANNLITAKYDGFGYKQWFNDPNLGQWYFRYNALGQLRWQKDANSVETRFDYDGLGRTTQRYIANVADSSWVFDTRIKGALSTESRGDLRKNYFYDSYARVIKQTTEIAHSATTRTFNMEYAYDGYYGRAKGMFYPTGELLAYQFDEYGYVTADVDPNRADALYRSVGTVSQHGKPVSQAYGNGLFAQRIYSASGDVTRVCVNSSASCAGASSLDEIHYDSYDNFGNLKSQNDLINNIKETYSYDNMHRIEQTTRSASGIVVPTFSPAATINFGFDASGNLLKKEDYANTYTYTGGASGGPNAVKSITKLDGSQVSFTYDSNGNLKTGDGISLTYNGFNKPVEIIRNNATLAFNYGADQQRYKQVVTTASKTVVTFYVDKDFEQLETTQGGSTTVEKRHYLGDHSVLTHIGSSETLSYLHGDRLGSASLITTGDQHLSDVSSFYQLVLERRGYDVFGKPRDLYWGDSLGGLLSSAISNRGFTGHEHLDDVELIHMNGRGYDYNLGRFLSVDPFIQMPGNSQSINPYSYGMNNPLAGTDPSGYLFWFIPMAIAAYNVYDSATAIADAVTTIADPNASKADKLMATADALGSLIDPTPGNIGKKGLKFARQAAKGKNTAKSAGAPSPSKSKSDVKKDSGGNKADAKASSGGDSQKGAKLGDVAESGGKKKPPATKKKVNGNSKSSTKAQHGYEIVDTKTGKVAKTGVSGGKLNKNGSSKRANGQANKWNKEAGNKGRYEPKVVKKVPSGAGARKDILEWEVQNADRLRLKDELDPTRHMRP